MNSLLEFTQLGKSYPTPHGPAVIIEDFSMHVSQGEFICITGHSGCGKSTVLSIVMGLNTASWGGVVLSGREITSPGTDRGVVFQSPSLLPWMSVVDNVLLALTQVKPDLPKSEQHKLAIDYLARVGLVDVADHTPSELSAGMRQRVGIARALALEPKVLLLDEPFSLLDTVSRMELQDELIRLLEKERKTVVMVTHDVDEAILLADRVVMMTNGPHAKIGKIMDVTLPRPRLRKATLEHPNYYGLREELIQFLADCGHALNRKSTDTH